MFIGTANKFRIEVIIRVGRESGTTSIFFLILLYNLKCMSMSIYRPPEPHQFGRKLQYCVYETLDGTHIEL